MTLAQDHRTNIAKRMERVGLLAATDPGDLERDPWQPRWTVKGKWVEFECTCRAELCKKLHGPKSCDPIIFAGTPQQAVYDYVCHRHWPGMNKYVHFGGFVDFGQWRLHRRAQLMGRVRP